MLLIFLCFPVCNVLAQQECPSRHYLMEDGLPSNNIYSILADSKGYLWFCTDQGVARYNGINFQTFTTRDGLSDNEVFFAMEDLLGRIWFATYSGNLCFFYQGVFHTAKNDSLLQLPFHHPFLTFINVEQDSSVTVFFNDRATILSLGKDRKYVTDLSNVQGIPNAVMLTNVRKKDTDTYELFYKDTRFSIRRDGTDLQRLPYRKNKHYNHRRDRIFDYLYSDNMLYTLDEEPVFKFARGFDSITVFWVHERGGIVFLGTDHGLFVNNDYRYLPGENVTTVVQDAEGNYWMSTLKNGVYYFDKNFLHQQMVRVHTKDEIGFSAVSDSTVIFSTIRGDLYRLKGDVAELVYSNTSYLPENKYGMSVSADMDKAGNFHWFLNKEEIYIRKPAADKPFIRRNILDIDVQARKLVVIGDKLYYRNPSCIGGLLYDTSGRRIDSLAVLPLDVSRWPFAITRSDKNELWYSMMHQVYKVTGDTPVRLRAFDEYIFKWFYVYEHLLLGCSIDNTLVLSSKPDGVPATVTITDSSCMWRDAVKLNDHQILLSTNGAYRLLTILPSEDTPRYTIHIVENPVVPVNAESICSDGNRCYFFKKGIISILETDDLMAKPKMPQVYFAKLTAGKKSIIPDGSPVSLPYAQARNVRITFEALTWSSKDIVYEYRIAKLGNEDWVATKANSIDMVNTEWGEYAVMVRACTAGKNCSPAAVLMFTIEKPFWITWWFIAVCSILTLGIVVILIRSMVRKRDREHRMRNEMLRSEYKAMNALMNPHLVFNVLNNVQGLIEGGDKVKAKEYLQTLSRLMRQNMHNVSKELIPLQKELQLLENYLKIEKLRFREWLNYVITVAEDVDVTDILLPPLLIQPLAENAILHGLLPVQSHDAMLTIDISMDGNDLVIKVTDNGVGLNKKHEREDTDSQPFGLSNVRKRIAQLSAMQHNKIVFSIEELYDAAGAVAGTQAIIRMAF